MKNEFISRVAFSEGAPSGGTISTHPTALSKKQTLFFHFIKEFVSWKVVEKYMEWDM